jgi:hypothetical protein
MDRPELQAIAPLLSYVPASVVEYYMDHLHPDTSKELEEQFDAVLMFADMSGGFAYFFCRWSRKLLNFFKS